MAREYLLQQALDSYSYIQMAVKLGWRMIEGEPIRSKMLVRRGGNTSAVSRVGVRRL